jgi:UDP-glucose 4-epimerase
MNCIVTGGAGFIGSHLVELLISEGNNVVVIDNLVSGALKNLNSVAKNSRFKFIKGDIRNPESLEETFSGADWVFHLAGLADIVPSIEHPKDYFDVNVTGTLNVLECSKAAGVKRFIYAASSSSYGIPNSYPTKEDSLIQPQYPYALTKYMGEELVLHWSKIYGLPSISLRLFNVYGVRSRTTGAYGAVFGVFLAQKLNKRPLTVVGDGNQTRDFTYVTDVAKAFLAAAKSKVRDESMNVGSGDHYSVNKLVNLLGGEVQYIPRRPGEPECTFADVSKIKNLLGWDAEICFEEGVNKLLLNIDDWSDAPVWDSVSIDHATKSWFKYLGKN